MIGDLGLLRSINCPCKIFIAFKQYAAPEVLHERKFSPASDMWSLGCVLLETISLDLIKERDAAFLPSTSPTVVEQELQRIAKLNMYSEELLGLVSALLRHDPDGRPSAHQLLRSGSCEMWQSSTAEHRRGVTLNHSSGFFGVC